MSIESDNYRTLFIVVLLIALLINALGLGLYKVWDSSYYWIDPISTTLSYVIWALVARKEISKRIKNNGYVMEPVIAFIGASSSIAAFTLWIIVSGEIVETNSTSSMAILFSPIVFLVIGIFGNLGGTKVSEIIQGRKGHG